MTTQRKLSIANTTQRKVIATLRIASEQELASALERCMAGRQNSNGRSRSCRSPGCVWCRQPMIHTWWDVIRDWAAPETSSLAIIRLLKPTGLRHGVQRLRRSLRDVGDRTARRNKHWRTVCFAGICGGDGTAFILVEHEGVDRHEVLTVLRRRWPHVVMKNLENEAPTSTMLVDDAADLARFRRGVEPLRIVILPQRDQPSAATLG